MLKFVEMKPGALQVGRLFDALLVRGNLKNDAALSRHLGYPQPVISKARSGQLTFGASMAVRVMEIFEMSLIELKDGLR